MGYIDIEFNNVLNHMIRNGLVTAVPGTEPFVYVLTEKGKARAEALKKK